MAEGTKDHGMDPLTAGATMVVHGPEVFDAGDAGWLIDLLSPHEVLVAGVMGRTAARESGLPVVCTDERPSVLLNTLPGRAFLVNRGRHRSRAVYLERSSPAAWKDSSMWSAQIPPSTPGTALTTSLRAR